MTATPAEAAEPAAAGCLAGIDVAILAGGLGTRLRDVLGDTPKILAPVAGRPFLDHLLARLAAEGAARIVLCLGHLADKVTDYLEDSGSVGADVRWIVEPQPLGTAGAVRHARDHLGSDPVLVMNGDTWIDADLAPFVAAHRRSGATASVLCVRVDDVGRYGSVEIDESGQVQGFVEKDTARTGPGVINGGVYLLSRAGLDLVEDLAGPSLERDVLPRLPAGTVRGHVAEGAVFIDIGTPESLAAAARVIGAAAGRHA